ncbi:hypothetical protein CPB83DRAFT_894331 [Crepidotus variabilis]|uniref:Protein kinase domain-containing protein n=1 Tax=Crepidotus variabilis TaxID=179855 RepID=A0A9P6EFF2_9AGAR|nr:hypothetical protein CPB83DRAFT_894331 [Crepidotus variabilis]
MLQYSSRPSPRNDFNPLADILIPGDLVGQGLHLNGEPLSLVANNPNTTNPPHVHFQVVKELGEGSYAVVYLVREILQDYNNDDTIGFMDEDPTSVLYGREYAIKCLSKQNLDQEALSVQMSEVDIHQSLRLHPNIVSLHRTLQTSQFLLLVLEYVPGQDLFFFLEQSMDHLETDSSQSCTPPTPSLLSTLHPSHLLSRTRLRLIASMFSQMCDAVAACHAQSVFHRDIKPENFIVTEGVLDGVERKVVVKLTDFGLSTKDEESADMDCGSAPYMSYECRNNVAPTYRPRGADVWSLGIVLINMLYHHNPWTDTSLSSPSPPVSPHYPTPCSSFKSYLADPTGFFMSRFVGMSRPLADLLVGKVFCILDDDSYGMQARQGGHKRMEASEFGRWVKQHLVDVLSVPLSAGSPLISSTSVPPTPAQHRLSLTMPTSYRPTSRPPSVYSSVGRLSVGGTPVVSSVGLPLPVVSPLSGGVVGGMGSPLSPLQGLQMSGMQMQGLRTLSRAPSLKPAMEREEVDVDVEREIRIDVDVDCAREMTEGQEVNGEVETTSRSTSTTRKRKRGLRKGRGASAHSHLSSGATPTTTPSVPVATQTDVDVDVDMDMVDVPLDEQHGYVQVQAQLPSAQHPAYQYLPQQPLSNPSFVQACHFPNGHAHAQHQAKDSTLDTLAAASQSLVRELSMASKASSIRSVSTKASSVRGAGAAGGGAGVGAGGAPIANVNVPSTSAKAPSLSGTSGKAASTISRATKSSFGSLGSLSLSIGSMGSMGSSNSSPASVAGGGGAYEPPSMYAMPSLLLSGSSMGMGMGSIGGHGGSGGSNGTKVRSPLGVDVSSSVGKESGGVLREGKENKDVKVEGKEVKVVKVESKEKEKEKEKATVTRKPSRWKLSFGRSGGLGVLASSASTPSASGAAPAPAPAAVDENASPSPSIDLSHSSHSHSSHSRTSFAPSFAHPHAHGGPAQPSNQRTMSTKASNVSSIIMGLNPPSASASSLAPAAAPASIVSSAGSVSSGTPHSTHSVRSVYMGSTTSLGSVNSQSTSASASVNGSVNGLSSSIHAPPHTTPTSSGPPTTTSANSNSSASFGFGTGHGIGSGVPPVPRLVGAARYAHAYGNGPQLQPMGPDDRDSSMPNWQRGRRGMNIPNANSSANAVNAGGNINGVNLASPPHSTHTRNHGRSAAGGAPPFVLSSSPPVVNANGNGAYQIPHHRAVSPPRSGGVVNGSGNGGGNVNGNVGANGNVNGHVGAIGNGKAKARWRNGNGESSSASGSTTGLGGSGSGLSPASASGPGTPNGSTAAFTRYPNNSARSVATTNSVVSTNTTNTMGSARSLNSLGSLGSLGSIGTVNTNATSVSSSGTSWRASVKTTKTTSSNGSYVGGVPRNIKIMDGVPWELDQLPRGQFPNPVGDIFGSPPVRNANGKQRTRKHKDHKLDTISERPVPGSMNGSGSGSSSYNNNNASANGHGHGHIQTPAEKVRRDAQTSTSDLVGVVKDKDVGESGDGVKKVQKGQINALAKMLSALRR